MSVRELTAAVVSHVGIAPSKWPAPGPALIARARRMAKNRQLSESMGPGSMVSVRIQGRVPGSGYEDDLRAVLDPILDKRVQARAAGLLYSIRHVYRRQTKNSHLESDWKELTDSIQFMEPDDMISFLDGHLKELRQNAGTTSTAARQTDDSRQSPLQHGAANGFGGGWAAGSLLPCVSGMQWQSNGPPFFPTAPIRPGRPVCAPLSSRNLGQEGHGWGGMAYSGFDPGQSTQGLAQNFQTLAWPNNTPCTTGAGACADGQGALPAFQLKTTSDGRHTDLYACARRDDRNFVKRRQQNGPPADAVRRNAEKLVRQVTRESKVRKKAEADGLMQAEQSRDHPDESEDMEISTSEDGAGPVIIADPNNHSEGMGFQGLDSSDSRPRVAGSDSISQNTSMRGEERVSQNAAAAAAAPPPAAADAVSHENNESLSVVVSPGDGPDESDLGVKKATESRSEEENIEEVVEENIEEVDQVVEENTKAAAGEAVTVQVCIEDQGVHSDGASRKDFRVNSPEAEPQRTGLSIKQQQTGLSTAANGSLKRRGLSIFAQEHLDLWVREPPVSKITQRNLLLKAWSALTPDERAAYDKTAAQQSSSDMKECKIQSGTGDCASNFIRDAENQVQDRDQDSDSTVISGTESDAASKSVAMIYAVTDGSETNNGRRSARGPKQAWQNCPYARIQGSIPGPWPSRAEMFDVVADLHAVTDNASCIVIVVLLSIYFADCEHKKSLQMLLSSCWDVWAELAAFGAKLSRNEGLDCTEFRLWFLRAILQDRCGCRSHFVECDIDMEQDHAAAALVVAKGVAQEAGISFEESDCKLMAAAMLTSPKARFYEAALRAVFLALLQGLVGVIVFEEHIGIKHDQPRVVYNPGRNILSENIAVLIPILSQDCTAGLDASGKRIIGAIAGNGSERRSTVTRSAAKQPKGLDRPLAVKKASARPCKNHFNMVVFSGDGSRQHVLLLSKVAKRSQGEVAGPDDSGH